MAALFFVLSSTAAEARESRFASIIIDAETGSVLEATNPDKRSYPASLAKMMTLYLLFEALDQGRLRLDSQLPVSSHAANQAPSKLGLRPGETIAVEEVVLALVTKSANDAAVVAAEALGGNETRFATMMTDKARALGMVNTTYRNASGLPDLRQISTPRDQAKLSRALIYNHRKYYRYFATREFHWRTGTIGSHNRLMLNYPGADGIKTGYINASGFNLAASAVRDGRRVIGVVFGGDTAAGRDRKMAQLLDKGFARINGGGQVMSASVDAEETPDAAEPAKLVKKASVQVAAKPKLKTKREVVKAAPEPSAWAIQVGAFNHYRPAHNAATEAAKKLGKNAVAHVGVDSTKTKTKAGQKTVYRARITGFSEDQAKAACRKLGKSKGECHVIQPTA